MNQWLFIILGKAIECASPAIVENLRQLVQEMVDKAAKTDSPWDDVLCGLVQMVVGKPGSKVDSPE